MSRRLRVIGGLAVIAAAITMGQLLHGLPWLITSCAISGAGGFIATFRTWTPR